jgi:hypothetical protein
VTVVRRRKGGIPYSQKWFARRAAFADAFGVVAYLQFLGALPGGPFFRRRFSTILIELERDPDAILADMQASVRSQIRRAEGEGFVWEEGVDPAEFARFHTAFARERGIEGVETRQLDSFGSALLLTRATREGRTLAQHAYVVDPGESRARNLYSSSGRFEGPDTHLVGRANRWCHWKDMLHLRERGIRTYDFGGIAVGAEAAARRGINDFKVGFGGRVVREDHWLSPLYALASAIGAR